MELVQKAVRAPIAGLLLARLADAAPSWEPAETRLLWSDELFGQVGVNCPMLPAGFGTAELDGVDRILLNGRDLERLSAGQARGVGEWVQQGGCLYIHGARPGHEKLLAAVSGHDVQLAEAPQSRLVFNRPGSGLSRGLSSADLYFIDHGARQLGQSLRRVQAAEVTIKATGRAVGVASTLESTSDCGLVELLAEKGRVVVDQVCWHVETSADARAGRYISTLLTNLGVPLAPRTGATPSALCEEVDISAACNSTLIDYIPGDGEGWTGRGPDSDLRAFSPGLLLAGGAPLHVSSADRNCCVLNAEAERSAGLIALDCKAQALVFLVTCEGHTRHGVPVGQLTVRREGNLETQIPLRYGIDVIDWNERPRDLEDASVAWKGFTALGEPAAVYVKKWENSRPDVPVTSLVFSSTRSGVVPILLAVTACR